MSNTTEGDGTCILFTPEGQSTNWSAISAIVIAIQMITKHCKKLKYKRKIVLVTDGRGSMDADDVSQITQKIKADEIELVVMYATYVDSKEDEN